MDASLLNVLTTVSNPVRYQSRYRLYQDFAKRVADSGARLWTAEIAFGDRPFAVTERGNPNHLQLRTEFELWHKENALNLLFQRLPLDWEYAAWIDADVAFARPDWAAETVHQLQHYQIVQLFSHCIDLAPDYSPLPSFYGPKLKPASWGYCYCEHLPEANTDLNFQLETGRMQVPPKTGEYGVEHSGYYWHPGFAWGINRWAFEKLGGLIDFSILGAGDHLMASALTGHLSLSKWMHPNYTRPILEWKDRADLYIRGDFGYVPGLLTHYWHGKKSQRGYKDRWRVFHDNGFDPAVDLKRDWQGLWQLTDRSRGLRDDLRAYFRARNEDSVDV